MKTTFFTVEGTGQFPFDMLRYDECFPRSEIDSGKISGDWGTSRRTVELVHYGEQYWGGPTVARWNSFTWAVKDS